MKAGVLKERLTFAKRQETDDGFGNVEGTWGSEFTVWARVMPLKGSEPVLAQRLTGVQPVVITVRRTQRSLDVGPEWRATDTKTGAVYNIRSYTPSENREFIDLLADSGGAV